MLLNCSGRHVQQIYTFKSHAVKIGPEVSNIDRNRLLKSIAFLQGFEPKYVRQYVFCFVLTKNIDV